MDKKKRPPDFIPNVSDLGVIFFSAAWRSSPFGPGQNRKIPTAGYVLEMALVKP